MRDAERRVTPSRTTETMGALAASRSFSCRGQQSLVPRSVQQRPIPAPYGPDLPVLPTQSLRHDMASGSRIPLFAGVVLIRDSTSLANPIYSCDNRSIARHVCAPVTAATPRSCECLARNIARPVVECVEPGMKDGWLLLGDGQGARLSALQSAEQSLKHLPRERVFVRGSDVKTAKSQDFVRGPEPKTQRARQDLQELSQRASPPEGRASRFRRLAPLRKPGADVCEPSVRQSQTRNLTTFPSVPVRNEAHWSMSTRRRASRSLRK